MRVLIASVAGSILLAMTFAGCTNTQPAYYGTYPTNFDFGANHGYDAYASAPYDPYGAYYQNFGPATPYYYEPPESHRNCDERPCIAYKRNAAVAPPVAPEIIALPQKKLPYNPPSTISRAPQSSTKHRRHRDADADD